MQVALLRWYDGNDAGHTFTVENGPRGVAFDGANIWVVNTLGNNVTKLKASDGSYIGAYPVGSTPEGVAFDGATSG
jgi:hypothetical protein